MSETSALIFNVVIGISLASALLSGMYITHHIYEEEETSFFEMYVLGFLMSLHLIPMFFSNKYYENKELRRPLWIFRTTLILTIGLVILKAHFFS